MIAHSLHGDDIHSFCGISQWVSVGIFISHDILRDYLISSIAIAYPEIASCVLEGFGYELLRLVE